MILTSKWLLVRRDRNKLVRYSAKILQTSLEIKYKNRYIGYSWTGKGRSSSLDGSANCGSRLKSIASAHTWSKTVKHGQFDVLKIFYISILLSKISYEPNSRLFKSSSYSQCFYIIFFRWCISDIVDLFKAIKDLLIQNAIL